MSTLTIVLADQLFTEHPALDKEVRGESDFVMIESLYEANRKKYHKFKLAFIFSTMREYADYLDSKDQKVLYFKLGEEQKILEKQKTKHKNQTQNAFKVILTNLIKNKGYSKIQITEISDKFFRKMIIEICDSLDVDLEVLYSPMFLYTKAKFNDYLDRKSTKSLIMANFYTSIRQDLGILVDQDNKPIGGKWSFDYENRQKLPKSVEVPKRSIEYQSKHYKDVCETINELFADNPGELLTKSHFGLNHKHAQQALDYFLKSCLENFGTYEDALTTRSEMVFHSALSPYLNCGLLTPRQVLLELAQHLESKYDCSLFKNNQMLESFEDSNRGQSKNSSLKTKHPKLEFLNSVEGFVRQIIGWREWIKGMYDTQYEEDLSQYNFWKNTKDLPEYFYWPTKALDSKDKSNETQEFKNNKPLQLALLKTEKLAYNQHTERLMVLANWCQLSEYDPIQVFNWFSEMYVDSAEWVMVPNVLGMGIFADGGIFATKPYVAGGNYIKKMSDYSNSKIWEPIWTDKFWNFLMKHEDYFESNPRLNMLIKSKKKRDSK